jgi:hypothetical protein
MTMQAKWLRQLVAGRDHEAIMHGIALALFGFAVCAQTLAYEPARCGGGLHGPQDWGCSEFGAWAAVMIYGAAALAVLGAVYAVMRASLRATLALWAMAGASNVLALAYVAGAPVVVPHWLAQLAIVVTPVAVHHAALRAMKQTLARAGLPMSLTVFERLARLS